MLRFVESVLGKPSHFFDTIRSELHGKAGVDVFSTEPKSKYSCFDRSFMGCDWTVDVESDFCHVWKECRLTVDDALHWESRDGKKATLQIYAVRHVELQCGYIKIWVEPKGSCDQIGVVEFRR